jgi:hypothetical protein
LLFFIKKIGSHGYGVKSSNGKVVSLKSFDMQRDIFDANELQEVVLQHHLIIIGMTLA